MIEATVDELKDETFGIEYSIEYLGVHRHLNLLQAFDRLLIVLLGGVELAHAM